MARKLVSVLGNSGVGKTVLTQALCDRFGYESMLETHEERPFQIEFMADLSRWGFHNQIDYLLYRAEQEYQIDERRDIVLLDGGLDNDFIFTGFFYEKGYLSQKEYAVCRRYYQLFRKQMGFPALFIYLQAPVAVIQQRRIQRNRDIDIIKNDDIAMIHSHLEAWIGDYENHVQIIRVPSDEEMLTEQKLENIAAEIEKAVL